MDCSFPRSVAFREENKRYKNERRCHDANCFDPACDQSCDQSDPACDQSARLKGDQGNSQKIRLMLRNSVLV